MLSVAQKRVNCFDRGLKIIIIIILYIMENCFYFWFWVTFMQYIVAGIRQGIRLHRFLVMHFTAESESFSQNLLPIQSTSGCTSSQRRVCLWGRSSLQTAWHFRLPSRSKAFALTPFKVRFHRLPGAQTFIYKRLLFSSRNTSTKRRGNRSHMAVCMLQ